MAKGRREQLNTWMDQALNHLKGAAEDLTNIALAYKEFHPEHASFCDNAVNSVNFMAQLLIDFQQKFM